MKKLLFPTLLIITIAIATGLYSQKFKDLDAMQHQTPVIESPSTPPVEEKKNDTPSNQDQSDQDPSNTSGDTSEDEEYTTITPGEYVPQDRTQSEVLIQKNIDFVEVFNFRDGYNFKLDVRKYDVRTWNREDHSVTIVPIDKKKDCGDSIERLPITTAKNIQDLIAFDPDYDPEPPTLNELTRMKDYPNIEAYLWIKEALGYRSEWIIIWANDHYYRFSNICEDLTEDILEHFELRDQNDQDPSNTSGNTSEDEDYTTITPGEYVPQNRPQSEVLIQKNIDFVEVFNFRDGYNFKLDVRKYDVRTWDREDHSVTIVPAEGAKACGDSIEKLPLETVKNIQELISRYAKYEYTPPEVNEVEKIDHPNVEAYLWKFQPVGFDLGETIIVWAGDRYYRFGNYCPELAQDILRYFELRK